MTWLAVLAILAGAACTPRARPSADRAAPSRIAQLDGIVRLEPARWVDAYTSPGGEERARQLQELTDGAIEYWSAPLGGGVHIVLAVLDEHDWKASTDDPYGFPHGNRGDPWIIYMPSVPMRSVVVDAMAPIAGNTRAVTMLDNIAVHEIGHAIAVERMYGPDPQPSVRWFDELIATYLAYAYLRTRAPERAIAWDEVTELVLAGTRPEHTSLGDFEHGRFAGPADYTWYELAFSRRVQTLYDRQGDAAITALKARLPWSRQNHWSSIELLGLLEPITPGFQAWAQSL